MLVSTVGAVKSYNGVTFGPAGSTTISVSPVFDSSGRTVKWSNFAISLTNALVEPNAGDTDTENALYNMRQRLLKNAGILKLHLLGFGPLTVNFGKVWDTNFGPKPDQNAFRYHGPAGAGYGVRAAIVDWAIQTWLPPCEDFGFYKNSPSELNYTIGVHKDRDGYSKIIIKGHIEIPMTKLAVDSTKMPDTIDRYKELLQKDVPLGFQRDGFTWDISEDRRRADFGYTDAQLPTPLPPGLTRCEVRHRWRSKGPAYVQQQHTISARMAVPPGLGHEWAARCFIGIALDRMRPFIDKAAKQARAPAAGNAVAGAVGNIVAGAARAVLGQEEDATSVLMPGDLEIENEACGTGEGGRMVNCSITYMVTRRGSVLAALAEGGLWKPMPGATWKAWRDSMLSLGVTHVRGPANIAFSPDDTAIVDLCVPVPPKKILPSSPNKGWGPFASGGDLDKGWGPFSSGGDRDKGWGPFTSGGGRDDPEWGRGPFASGGSGRHRPGVPKPVPRFPSGRQPRIPGGDTPGQDIIEGPHGPPAEGALTEPLTLPRPEQSWLEYNIIATYDEETGRFARHKPLSGTLEESHAAPLDAARSTAAQYRASVAGGDGSCVWVGAQDILQEVGAPAGVVWLEGYAVRIGASIPLPNLLSFGGALAVLDRTYATAPITIGRWGDMRIVLRRWRRRYLLAKPPERPQGGLVDPVLGFNGQG